MQPQTNTGMKTTLILADEFDGSALNDEIWRIEDMRGKDCLHRTGNFGIDEHGQPGDVALGQRWALKYDKYHDELLRISDSVLSMRVKMTSEKNPTRANYMKGGTLQPYGDNTLYGCWIDGWARCYSSEHDAQITDPDCPNQIFKIGKLFEFRVNFENMCIPGARSSGWGMCVDKGEIQNRAYNDNAADGIEVDFWEYDPADPRMLMMKCVGGAAGDTPNGMVNLLDDFGIDISKGWHTIAVLWTEEALVWYVDGIEVQRETERVPLVDMYIMLSREGNSGVKQAWDLREGDVLEEPPFMPHDGGLFGVSVIENMHKQDKDEFLIDWARVYDISANDNTHDDSGGSFGDRLSDLQNRNKSRAA